jgi:hypothetical protein
MQVTVLVEPLANRTGYRARSGEPFNVSAEGPTAVEAVCALECVLRARIEQGAAIATIQLGPTVPLIRTSGGLADDEATRAWLDAIEENRRLDD